LTESEIVFQKFEVWNQYGLKATHTRKERKRVKLATFTLTFLILGSLAFLMPTVQTQVPPVTPVPVTQVIPLEGNVTFKVYPDGSIKMNVVGSIEQAIETDFPPPVYYAYFNLAKSPSGVNLTKTKGIIVMKLSPMYSTLLAALDLDIEAHGEDLRSNTTILFNMPGYLGVNGTLGAVGDESTGEGTYDFDLTATIWYPLVPKEEVQEFIQMFPTLKSQITTQISELTEGNITLQELTLVSREIDYYSTSLTITGCLVGDFVKGGMALSTNITEQLLAGQQTTTYLSPEELMSMKAKSADIHIRFDKNELAFLMDSENVIEGDMDKLINVMMDAWWEEYLQDPYLLIDPETALMINDVLIPTDISTENLNFTFEYSFDGEKLKLDFAVEGLGLSPPTTEAFLTILDKAFTGVSLPGFSLVLEGGSDEESFVEIEVPPTTSEPVMAFPRKVVWIVDNLTNLNLVSFKVRELPTPPPPPPPPPKPAEFVISDLSITPEEVDFAEEVEISFTVTNIGELPGDYAFTLEIEGPLLTGSVVINGSLEAGKSERASYMLGTNVPGTYSVELDGLTGSFTMKELKPAEFEFSNLRIFYPGVIPPEVERDETVTVTVSIEAENVGELEGGRMVELKVDESVVDSQEVTLEGGTSETVLFELERGEGTYEVEVEGFTESFTVLKSEPPFWNRPELVMAVIGIAIAVAVAGYMLMKRR